MERTNNEEVIAAAAASRPADVRQVTHSPRRRWKRWGAATMIAGLALYSGLAGAGNGDAYQQSYNFEVAGKVARALKALDGVRGPQRDSYIFHLRQGWLLYLNARYEEAIATTKRALKKEPKSLEAHLYLTLPQMALHRWQDAAKTAEAALRLDADNYLATSRLAFCNQNLGRFADAERLYRRLVALYPADVEMQVGLGWALLKLRKNGQAARVFEKVLSVAPGHVMARQGLRIAQ